MLHDCLNNIFLVDMSFISSFVIQGFLVGRIRILLKGACESTNEFIFDSKLVAISLAEAGPVGIALVSCIVASMKKFSSLK